MFKKSILAIALIAATASVVNAAEVTEKFLQCTVETLDGRWPSLYPHWWNAVGGKVRLKQGELVARGEFAYSVPMDSREISMEIDRKTGRYRVVAEDRYASPPVRATSQGSCVLVEEKNNVKF